MVIPFDPHHITPHVSMNRVKIVDLPGLNIPDEIKGKTGFQLLSSQALIERIQALQYTPETVLSELPILFDRCLTSENPAERAAAEGIGRQWGRNLGYLLLTLKRGDSVNRAARDEWDDSYWDYWAKIKCVWLGGGQVSGNLGKHIRTHALAVFVEAGILDFNLHISPYGSALPLIGAARYASGNCEKMLVFDFGGTFIKRAVAKYDNHTLVELQRLPSVPSKWMESDMDAQNLYDYLVQVIVETQESVGIICDMLVVSMACYMADGHPQENQGGAYAQMRLITDNLQNSLSESLSQKLKMPISLRLIHDGTAAATTYAGSLDTAVLMIGTSLGIGFPPPSDAYLCKIKM